MDVVRSQWVSAHHVLASGVTDRTDTCMDEESATTKAQSWLWHVLLRLYGSVESWMSILS